MRIHPSLLTTLLISVLGATPPLVSQAAGTLAHSATQLPSGAGGLDSRDHKEATASIDINTADAKALLELKGVGAKRAQTIISYREQHGPFKSVDDLMNVKGISKKTVEENYDKITV